MRVLISIVVWLVRAGVRRAAMLERRPLHASRPPRVPHLQLALCVSFAGLAAYALYPGVAAAQFDSLANSVHGTSVGWFNTLQGLVRPTFLMVATIEICWAAAVWAFERDSLNSLSVEIIKKVITHGFFYAVLLYAGDWVPAIADSFEFAGEQIVGQISTDKIIEDGLGIIADLWGNVAGQVMLMLSFDPEEIAGFANPVAYSMLDLGEAQLVLTGIISLLIAFAYLVTAAQYFLLKIEAYVLFAAGAMYLGFGGASWGKDYVMKYLNYAVNAGVRLLVLILTLSLTMSAVSNSGGFIFAFDIVAELKLLGLAVLQAILAVKAPDMAGGLMGFPGAGLTANGVFSSALNTISQVQMIGMAMRGGMGGAARGAEGHGHGGEGSHNVGRAANLGNTGNRGAPGPRGTPSEARNAAGSVRGLGDASPSTPRGRGGEEE